MPAPPVLPPALSRATGATASRLPAAVAAAGGAELTLDGAKATLLLYKHALDAERDMTGGGATAEGRQAAGPSWQGDRWLLHCVNTCHAGRAPGLRYPHSSGPKHFAGHCHGSGGRVGRRRQWTLLCRRNGWN